MGKISSKCLRVVTAFLKILYLDGLRSEVEQFSMRVHPFGIFLLQLYLLLATYGVVEGQLRAW